MIKGCLGAAATPPTFQHNISFPKIWSVSKWSHSSATRVELSTHNLFSILYQMTGLQIKVLKYDLNAPGQQLFPWLVRNDSARVESISCQLEIRLGTGTLLSRPGQFHCSNSEWWLKNCVLVLQRHWHSCPGLKVGFTPSTLKNNAHENVLGEKHCMCWQQLLTAAVDCFEKGFISKLYGLDNCLPT